MALTETSMIDELAPEHLVCRVFEHAWDIRRKPRGIVSTHDRRGRACMEFDLPCVHGCGTVKRFRFYPSGRAQGRLDYPDGYLLRGIRTRPPRTEFRKAYIHRVLERRK